MTTTNALVYYHELVKAGMPDEQAFNQAMAFDNAISHLATKDHQKRSQRRQRRNQIVRTKNIFPKPIKLSSRSVGWLEFEVNDWIDQRIKVTRGIKKGD